MADLAIANENERTAPIVLLVARRITRSPDPALRRASPADLGAVGMTDGIPTCVCGHAEFCRYDEREMKVLLGGKRTLIGQCAMQDCDWIVCQERRHERQKPDDRAQIAASRSPWQRGD